MPEDMVTVPADALHAVLGVFARIEQLAKSPAIRELREAVTTLGGEEDTRHA